MSEVRLFKATCLTPVHVGSGEELRRDVQFCSLGGRTFLVDLQVFLRLSARYGDLADEVARGATLRDIFERRKIAPAEFGAPSVPRVIEASRLRLAVRTGDGRPLLPGSSWKGAIRTVLFAAWACDGKPHSSLSPAFRNGLGEVLRAGRKPSPFTAQPLEKLLFQNHTRGKALQGPHGDVMRLLGASDVAFGADQVEIYSAKAVNTRRTTLTAVEALKPGAVAPLALRTTDGIVASLGFRRLPKLEEIISSARAHARFLLEQDLEYFRKLSVATLADRCRQLLALEGSLPEGSMLLRLGWGTGWHTMTGAVVSDTDRQKLGVRAGKTRKVVLAGHAERSEPADVFGWVRLDPIGRTEAERLLVPPLRHEPVELAVAEVSSDKAVEPVEPIPDVFAQQVAALTQRDFGRMREMVAEALRPESEEDRRRRLELLASRARELWGSEKKLLKKLREISELAPFLSGGK